MKQQTIWRLSMVFGVLAAGLTACSEPVKTTTSVIPTHTPTNESRVTAQSAMQQAKEAYQRKDYAKAVEWFHKAADQGDAKAQYNLGLFYSEGKGIEQDYTQAAEWFRKAADQGLAQAQRSLGLAYRDGLGVDKDPEQAKLWLGKAAAQGDADAQAALKGSGKGAKSSSTSTKSKSTAAPKP